MVVDNQRDVMDEGSCQQSPPHNGTLMEQHGMYIAKIHKYLMLYIEIQTMPPFLFQLTRWVGDSDSAFICVGSWFRSICSWLSLVKIPFQFVYLHWSKGFYVQSNNFLGIRLVPF